jgi:putative SOS response-associated peptidase YedK
MPVYPGALISRFFENVPRHLYEHRDLLPEEKPENLILQFAPRPNEDMLVACIWDQWKGPDLLSFAAITDEPPPEIAATRHQRCVIVIEEKNLNTWLFRPGRLQPSLTQFSMIVRSESSSTRSRPDESDESRLPGQRFQRLVANIQL